MKSYVVAVDEIDEPEVAVKLLKEKLSKLPPFGKNTIGIISAHADMVYSGVYSAVCKELPFPLAGFSCGTQAANDSVGTDMFSIMFLTGDDDFEFACGHSEQIVGEPEQDAEKVKDCFLRLREQLSGKPKLALMYASFGESRFPSDYIDEISSLEPELPVFGAVALCDTTEESMEGNITFCDKTAAHDKVAIVLLSGDFTPKFFMSSLDDKMLKARDIGVVTKCDRNKLLEINDINAAEFLEKFGFDKNIESSFKSISAAFKSTVFAFDAGCGEGENCDYENESQYFDCNVTHSENPAAKRQMVSRSPVEVADTAMIFNGKIIQGANISIASSTPESVMSTTGDIINSIKASKTKTALIYSCIGRQVGLYNKPMKEYDTFKSELSGEESENKINFSVSSAGGEFCPVGFFSGKPINHEHNQTLIACGFF